MLKLVKETGDHTVPYDAAVIEAKKIMSEIEGKSWRLARLANLIEPKYGADTIGRFAVDIGMNPLTLGTYRGVARAWPESSTYVEIPFAVARLLTALPNREEIIRNTPNLTVAQARRIAMEARSGTREADVVFPYQEPCTDCNTAQEQWQRSVGNMLGDILSFRSYWDHLFGPEWKQYKIPSSHLTLAAQAKRELISLVASLKEHQRDKEN